MITIRRSPESLSSLLVSTKIVAAVPCYNTEKHISRLVAELQKYVDEVIVVDDGSTDNTAELALIAGAKVVRHKKNLGKGAAMKSAAEIADTDILIFIDGDGQHDPRDIPRLLEPIIQEDADFVIGSRYMRGSRVSADPFIRRLANGIASLTISTVISFAQPLVRFIRHKPAAQKTPVDELLQNIQTSGVYDFQPTSYSLRKGSLKWISDCTSGFTAMKMKNWNSLQLVSNRYQIETEMIFEQAKNNYLIAETPISCTWENSVSKLSVTRDGLATLSLLVKKLAF